jgi:hypothetical protein
MKLRSVGSAVAIAAMSCAGLSADDKWEGNGTPFFRTDDTVQSSNQLLHGVVQTHDFQGIGNNITPGDQDFSLVATKARHSYEVKVFSTNSCFLVNPGDPANPNSCAGLARVAYPDGTTILTAAIAPDGVIHPYLTPTWLAVRWIASADQFEIVRVNGYLDPHANALNQYDIQMLDTTYLVPRWNNSGTQVTVFLIQNGSTAPVTGKLFFYNAGGALLDTQPLTLAGHALQVVSTSGILALAGASGSAAIAHDGGYGALAGKVVSVEPSTGFTFDTQISAIPH